MDKLMHLGSSQQQETFLCTIKVHSLTNIPLVAGSFRVRWKFRSPAKEKHFESLDETKDKDNESGASTTDNSEDESHSRSGWRSRRQTHTEEEDSEKRGKVGQLLSTAFNSHHRGAFSERSRPRSISNVSAVPSANTRDSRLSISINTQSPSHHTLAGDMMTPTAPRFSIDSRSSGSGSRYTNSSSMSRSPSGQSAASPPTFRYSPPDNASPSYSDGASNGLSSPPSYRPSSESQRRGPNLSLQTDVPSTFSPAKAPSLAGTGAGETKEQSQQRRAESKGSTPWRALNNELHSVTFDHSFICPVTVTASKMSVIQPCILKLTVRQEEVPSQSKIFKGKERANAQGGVGTVDTISEVVEEEVQSPTAPLTAVPPTASKTSYHRPWENSMDDYLPSPPSNVHSSPSSSSLRTSYTYSQSLTLTPNATVTSSPSLTPQPSRERFVEPSMIDDRVLKKQDLKLGHVDVDLTKYIHTHEKEVKFLLTDSKTNATLRVSVIMKQLGSKKNAGNFGSALTVNALSGSHVNLNDPSLYVKGRNESTISHPGRPPYKSTASGLPNNRVSSYANSIHSLRSSLTRSDTMDTGDSGNSRPSTLKELLEYGDPSHTVESDHMMREVLELLRLSRPAYLGGPITEVIRPPAAMEPFPRQDSPVEERERERPTPPSPKLGFLRRPFMKNANNSRDDVNSVKGLGISMAAEKDDDARSVRSLFAFTRSKKNSLNVVPMTSSERKDEPRVDGENGGESSRKSMDSINSQRPSIRSRKSSRPGTGANMEDEAHATVKIRPFPVFTTSPRNSMDSASLASSIHSRPRTRSTRSTKSSREKSFWGLGRNSSNLEVYDLEPDDIESGSTKSGNASNMDSFVPPLLVVTDSRTSTELA
ncbi:hypothetical protein BT69DRAFT_1279478 [Atractiella rhizophila]|nr:hypothetical protein BT69DRAFT_1279478 [Atractiella rhizophila]